MLSSPLSFLPVDCCLKEFCCCGCCFLKKSVTIVAIYLYCCHSCCHHLCFSLTAVLLMPFLFDVIIAIVIVPGHGWLLLLFKLQPLYPYQCHSHYLLLPSLHHAFYCSTVFPNPCSRHLPLLWQLLGAGWLSCFMPLQSWPSWLAAASALLSPPLLQLRHDLGNPIAVTVITTSWFSLLSKVCHGGRWSLWLMLLILSLLPLLPLTACCYQCFHF